jgi:hypothetical protein
MRVYDPMEKRAGMVVHGLEGMDRGGWMERRSRSERDQAAAGRVRREEGGEDEGEAVVLEKVR